MRGPSALGVALLLAADDGEPAALFSGGSLMVGTAGRTDLLGPQHTDELAWAQFHSLRDRILTLPDDLPVYPTHGAGSFCAAPGGAERVTSVGRERARNPLLQLTEESEFVERLRAGFGTFPPFFGRLPEVNRVGPRIRREDLRAGPHRPGCHAHVLVSMSSMI